MRMNCIQELMQQQLEIRVIRVVQFNSQYRHKKRNMQLKLSHVNQQEFLSH